MIEDIRTWVRREAPGPVTAATYDGMNLSIGGERRGFGSTCPWRICESGDLVAGCGDGQVAGKALERLVGARLIDVFPQGQSLKCDPVLVFSSRHQLEVFSRTQVDPWTFVTPHLIYVGAPGDSRYNR